MILRSASVVLALLLASVAAAGGAAPQGGGGGGGGAPVPDAGAPSAVDSAIEAQARRLAAELRCPVCQGLSLHDSPSELAREMKDLIRERLRAGDSPAEVKAYFVSRYGEWVLMEPPARGFNLAVWAVPVLAILGGVAFVIYIVRRWTRRPAPAEPPPLDDEDRARVRRELERLEADRD